MGRLCYLNLLVQGLRCALVTDHRINDFCVATGGLGDFHGGMGCIEERRRGAASGFTRFDLGAICAALALVALLVAFPRTVRAGLDGNAAACINNLRRLGLAWTLYAADNQDRVVNNFTIGDLQGEIFSKTYRSWTHNLLDWTVAGSNTNLALARSGRLFPYHDNDVTVIRCPADNHASAQQKARGWSGRVRSYSMNGFMGSSSASAPDPSNHGDNDFVPGYRQFLVTAAIPSAAETMVFLDEHPDSINDGYFVNTPVSSSQWLDLPGSQHDGGAGMVMADGSASIHLWQFASTKQPAKFGAPISTAIPAAQRGDYRWLTDRMTVSASTMAVHRRTNDTVEIVWSANPTAFELQSMNVESGGGWQAVAGPTTRGLGRATKTVPVGDGATLFRLIR